MFALLSSSLFLFSFALAVLITFSIIRGSRNSYVPATSTVLHSFSIRTEPGSEPYIHVVGRHKGILAWILSGLNIENKVELKVTERDWSLRDASLSGMRVEYFPLKNVSASICGYQRSRIALFFSVFFALVSLGTLAEAIPGIGTILNAKSEYIRESTAGDVSAVLGRLLLWTLLCGIALLIYITSKRVAFGVRANGVTGIVFKRSLIENKVIDLADAELATVLMNHLFSSAVYGMPISQVLRGGTPQAPSSGSRTSWGWIAAASYLGLACLTVGLAWYGRGITVEVTTQPVGAPVFEDGAYIGNTTKDASVIELAKTTREAHSFTSELEGYAPINETVRVGGLLATQNIVLRLTPLKFPLTLYTSPAGAHVNLDGRDAGTSDASGKLVIPDVEHGVHQFTVSSAGYESKTGQIEIYSSPRNLSIVLVNEAQAAQEAAQARQQEVNAHLDRAHALFRQGQYQQALDECNAALALDATNAAAVSLKNQIEQTRKILGQ